MKATEMMVQKVSFIPLPAGPIYMTATTRARYITTTYDNDLYHDYELRRGNYHLLPPTATYLYGRVLKPG